MSVLRANSRRGWTTRSGAGQVLPAILLVLTGGCRGGNREQGQSGATGQSQPVATHSALGEHEHYAPHDGFITSVPTGHLELVVRNRDDKASFTLYTLDPDLGPRSMPRAQATLQIALPDYPALKPSGTVDTFSAEGPRLPSPQFVAVAVIKAPYGEEVGRFVVDLNRPRSHKDRLAAARAAGMTGDTLVGRILRLDAAGAACLSSAAATAAATHGSDVTAAPIPDCLHQTAAQAPPGDTPAAPTAPWIIWEEATDRLYVALPSLKRTPAEVLAPLAGRRAIVSGRLIEHGGSRFMVVDEALAEHDHSARHGGLVAMVGELHLEAVAFRDGEVQVYLSDTFRRPLPATGHRGSVELQLAGSPRMKAPLVAHADGQFLTGQLGPLPQSPLEVTVRLPVPGDPAYFITFPLTPRSRPSPAAPLPAAIVPLNER